MTAFTTIVGILAIARGTGAGGEPRAPLGVAMAGGMLFSTALPIFVVPGVYVLLERARRRVAGRAAARGPSPSARAAPQPR